jgi:enoyl-CoA hydratase/carnithine racemase
MAEADASHRQDAGPSGRFRSFFIFSQFFQIERFNNLCLIRLRSADGTNRLTRACVLALAAATRDLAQAPAPLIITGNDKFFSAGADLNEIAALTGAAAYEFAKMGQELMSQLECFPAPVFAAISGYCMGGGLDLALACHRRIASPHAVFGHRGAALGLITGWGGTQRLPRSIGKAKALEVFLTVEKIRAAEALQTGLVEWVAEDPLEEAARRLSGYSKRPNSWSIPE